MKIFVTGADGQLGMSLRKIAGEYPRHEFLFAGRAAAECAQYAQCDICGPESARRLIGAGGAELIINCAAYTAVDRAESEPEIAEAVNHAGVRNLAEIARGFGVPLIHISTDYVFGGRGNQPLTEEDMPDPQCVYGRTKLAGEEAVRASGCDAAVIRTSWLYSEYGHNFVRTMLRLGASGGCLRVVDDQTGCPTYAADLARAIMRIAENGVRGFGIYNFCNEGRTTWYGFAREIFRQAGMDVCVEPVATADYPTAACRPAYSALATDKIRAAGVTVRSWEEALGECLSALGFTDRSAIK